MKQTIIKTGQVALIVFGVLLIQGALGSSDNLAISFSECLIRCLIGMAMIAGAIWLPRIAQAIRLHKQKKRQTTMQHNKKAPATAISVCESNQQNTTLSL